MNTTTYIHYAEPTMRSNAAQAYSECLHEPNYGYAPQPNYVYGSYYNEQAPMPQQPMPVQAPVAQSSSAGKGLLFVAGLAVVGAAAFGGVYLMNSTNSEPTAATAAAPSVEPSTVVNLPKTVNVPSAPAPSGLASVPMIVNNPAPVRVSGPAFSAQKPVAVPKPVIAPAPAAAAAPAPAPNPASVAAPAPGPGVSVKAPGVEVGVPSQGGVSVKTPGVDVGVPGQGGGDVVVAVPGGDSKPAEKPATVGDVAGPVAEAGNGALGAATGVAN